MVFAKIAEKLEEGIPAGGAPFRDQFEGHGGGVAHYGGCVPRGARSLGHAHLKVLIGADIAYQIVGHRHRALIFIPSTGTTDTFALVVHSASA